MLQVSYIVKCIDISAFSHSGIGKTKTTGLPVGQIFVSIKYWKKPQHLYKNGMLNKGFTVVGENRKGVGVLTCLSPGATGKSKSGINM